MPAGQALHAPPEGEVCPAGQGVQEDAPPGEVCPAGQLLHIEFPGLCENILTGHLVQDDEPAAENEPGAHCAGVTPLPGQKEPAGQVLHDTYCVTPRLLLYDPTEIWPAGQNLHDDDPSGA